MNTLKRISGIMLSLCMVLSILVIPTVDASAKAKAPSSAKIIVGQQNSGAIEVTYSANDKQIMNIKSSSKNLLAVQTYQYAHEKFSYSNKSYGYANIGLYAKKKGNYKVTFDVCDAKGKKNNSYTVKVSASGDSTYVSPVKKITFDGKADTFYNVTTKKSGKFKVTMNSGYSIKSIKMHTYDKDGNLVTKTIKNNQKVTLGNYAYINENENISEYSDYFYYFMSTNQFATTEFEVTYMDKKTKATGTFNCFIYRMPLN